MMTRNKVVTPAKAGAQIRCQSLWSPEVPGCRIKPGMTECLLVSLRIVLLRH